MKLPVDSASVLLLVERDQSSTKLAHRTGTSQLISWNETFELYATHLHEKSPYLINER